MPCIKYVSYASLLFIICCIFFSKQARNTRVGLWTVFVACRCIQNVNPCCWSWLWWTCVMWFKRCDFPRCSFELFG